MRLGETNPDLRTILLTIYTEDGSALAPDAAVGMIASDLKKAANDGSLVDAGGTLEHVEDGLYKYTATLPEASEPGFLAIVFIRAGFSVAIGWANVGQIFKLGETDPTLLRLPVTIFDEDGALSTTASVTLASQMRTNINGGAFANVTNPDPADSLVPIGHGLYYIQGVPADAATEGARGYKFEKAGFGTAITWVAVAEPVSAGIVIEAIAPSVGETLIADDSLELEVSVDGGDIDAIDSIEIRLIGSGVFTEIYDGAAFVAPYDGEVDILGGVAEIVITPSNGWIVGVAEARVTATSGATQDSDTIGSWFAPAAVVEEDDAPTAILVPVTVESPLPTIDHIAAALGRLPEQLRRPRP